MQDRRFKLLLFWNVVLTVIVLASLGTNAYFVQAASDPPVKVFATSSDDADMNGGTSGAVVINGKRVPLVSLEVNLSSAYGHYCIAVASIEVKQPKERGRYDLYINSDEGTFPYAGIRDLQFDNVNENNRGDIREVTTVFVRNMKPGNHTFTLYGNKVGDSAPDLTIAKSIMYALCMDRAPSPT